MQRIILLLAVFTLQINFAQNTSPFPISGNVGIGTINPLYPLDVVGGGRFKVPDDKSGIGGLTIETYNGSNLKIGGNSTYSWIQSHMSLPLYINELGNNVILNLAGGRVGIGTSNPLAKLEVKNGNILIRNSTNVDNESSIMIAQSINAANYDTFGTSIRTITQSAGNNTYGMQLFTQESFLTGQTEKIRIQGNGNVGIGTINPTARLDAMNSIAGVTLFKAVGINGYIAIDNVGAGENYYNANKFHEFQINGIPKIRINSEGNVGIGISNPTNKLDVNGTIHSKEVKVDMTGWSDFVFKKDYALPTLDEVEQHIAEKGHLENIPSEDEILKNGINLGEMNAKLLQKIEELTLYMIEMKKENMEIKNQNFSIREENNLMKKNQITLEKRILKIENK